MWTNPSTFLGVAAAMEWWMGMELHKPNIKLMSILPCPSWTFNYGIPGRITYSLSFCGPTLGYFFNSWQTLGPALLSLVIPGYILRQKRIRTCFHLELQHQFMNHLF